MSTDRFSALLSTDAQARDCAESRFASEAAFEQFAHAPNAGLGAELREWLPSAWFEFEACMASARMRW